MRYDLMLTGGEVLDPAAGLREVMDIGIAGGKIVAVAPSLPANEARRTISAKGRLVTPGLVDMHAHVFVNAHDMGGLYRLLLSGQRRHHVVRRRQCRVRNLRRPAPCAGS